MKRLPISVAAGLVLTAGTATTLFSCRSGQGSEEPVRSTTVDVGGPVHTLRAGPPDAPVVLFLHDASFTAETWRELGTLQSVASLGLHAVAIDLPSFGRSPLGTLSTKEFLLHFLDALGWDEVCVVAPSASGKYALRCLANTPERLWGMIAIAPVGIGRFARDMDEPSVPSLLVWGELDRIVARADADVLLAVLPNARLEVLEGAGHACYVERTERFNALVQAFLCAHAR